MTVYTYSQARQNFSDVLDRAKQDGEVLIKRMDGSLFSLTRTTARKSPLDVKGASTRVARSEIIAAVRESRAR